jgi:tetratricopeptide (TPR) repeat protein
MPITKFTKITTSQAVKLIEEAKNAELCRNISASQRILSAVWENLEEEPTLNGLSSAIRAEILRLCGVFLSFYGRSHNLKDYQERGKNFLTRAVEMFYRENLPHKSAEAKVMLSACYWYEGAIAESELILSEIESEYSNNQTHPVYIQICVNRLATHYWKGVRYKDSEEFQKGMEIIEELAVPIELCDDLRLKAMYHNQAGIFHRALKQPSKAVFHYNEAIKTARKSQNLLFVAANLNNLAYLCKEIGDYKNAHNYISESCKIFEELDEPGWLAHTLDTKAHICLAEEKLASALISIDKALNIFRKGEDYSGLADAVFTKCKILLQLGRVSEAIKLSAELIDVANQRIGEFAADKYADEFAKLVYPLKNNSYPNEVKSFKMSLLRNHLAAADLQITKAAETLGISHQNLSDILNNQFPELYIELGIKRRSRRNGKKRDVLPNISPVRLSVEQMSYDDALLLNEDASYYTFALNGKRLPSLKTKENIIVLVEDTEQTAGATVIMQNQKTGEFHCGVLEIDNLTGIFYLNDSSVKDDFPYLLDDFKYFGKVVGYCLLEKDSGMRIFFRPF